jgi:hypothetical protein
MTASFRKIDYSLRPAKHAERRMLCDILRRLGAFQRVEEYLYVGFGSVWFSDFSLFHKSLGIRDMVSIEQEEASAARIEANKPFRIAMDFRQSKFALPDLDWSRRQILWLDYDGKISTDILLDVSTIAANAKNGTLIAVSVQCHDAKEIEEAEAERWTDQNSPTALDRFRQKLGRDRVPQGLSEEDLIGWPFGSLCRSMIVNEIEVVLANRIVAQQEKRMMFDTICEFEYQDGAKMTTLVGIFHNDPFQLEKCAFGSLDFLKPDTKVVRIAVPKLTSREFRQLEKQLPLENGQELECGEIPVGEARHFPQMYRYLPNFAIIEG